MLGVALGISFLLSTIALVAVAWFLSGATGALAAAAAALSCVAGVLVGCAAASMFDESQVLERLGAGMLPRMFLPLFIFLILHETSPTLVSAGLAYYTIAVYLCLLAAETYFAVRRLSCLGSTGGAG